MLLPAPLVKQNGAAMTNATTFNDIGVIACEDSERISHNYHRFRFTLSAHPPEQWRALFHEEMNRLPIGSAGRDAKVVAHSDQVATECMIDQLEEHSEAVKHGAQRANVRYRQLLLDQESMSRQARDDEEQERAEVAEAIRRLKF